MKKSSLESLRCVSLEDKYLLDATRAYMTGIEALVRLPMLQHQRDREKGLCTAGFVSGYRGSPLGGVDQAMWRAKPHLDKHHIHFEPGINEDLAATAVWGSQQTNLFSGSRYDGVFGMWYGKGPGVDRSMDVIKHGNAFGTSRYGGVLAIAGDDHACKSSTLPHQSEHMFIGASVPVLAPANVQEVLDLGIYGWELSRYCGCWVGLKAITENMDSAISADIDPRRVEIVLPEEFSLPEDGVHGRWPDTPLAQEERLNKYKIYAAREFAKVNQLNKVVLDSPHARLGIITTGKAYLDVMQALDDMGIDKSIAASIGIRVFKVGMPWPLEPQRTHEFAEGLEEILVVEEKRSIIEDQLTSQLYNYPVAARPKVIGEFDECGAHLLTNTGELTPAMVALAIASRIKRFFNSEALEARISWIERKEKSLSKFDSTAERPPHFCSGCPHNTSTRIPDGSDAMGGIGCHYMAIWEPDRATQTFTQMGGEGATWLGQSPFTERKHVFQNLGDGTYFHSGVLAIRAAVAAGVNITYKILYNEAVAMTGGQPIDGQLSIENLISQLNGEGVQRIALVSDAPNRYRGEFRDVIGYTLHHRDELDTLQRELRDYRGCSVLIYQQACAAEKRRKQKKLHPEQSSRRIFINPDICEGCGDCGLQSNCLSVLPKETNLGRKRQINQHACNHDFSCLRGFCPSFVSVLNSKLKKPPFVLTEQGAFGSLPKVKQVNLKQPWNIVVAGVGGTGVVTVTALIAMAAHIEGKGCATLNQTGLAQKFGAVVSHVRIAKDQGMIKAVRVPAGEADLLVGCDLVVSAAYETMGKTAKKRTSAIINDAEQPTASFLHDPDAELPTQKMRKHIEEQIGESAATFVNATKLTEQILGDPLYLNLFLVGIAYQEGRIPVSAEALEAAIELNGNQIELNKHAFTLGRNYAVRPEKILGMINNKNEKLVINIDLDELIADRAERLVSYQSPALANQFRELIDAIRCADPKCSREISVTRVVTEQLYRLMAIKDEYEIGRLFSKPEFLAQLDANFEPGYTLQFHLAAPLFSRKDKKTGEIKKSTYGSWMMLVFKFLSKLRWIRNTPIDPFGRTSERRLARADLCTYLEDLDFLAKKLCKENYTAGLKLASLPQTLRGFGHVRNEKRIQLEKDRSVIRNQMLLDTSTEASSFYILAREAD